MKLELHIECGESTCASEPGKFCRFIGTRKFGQLYVCCLFSAEDRRTFTALEEKDGWVQRCADCLNAEEKSK